MPHTPVLLKEVLELLDPKPGEFFIDGTAGALGHAKAIEEKIGPSGKLLAIDWEKTGENYADLPRILADKGLGLADGLLLDLGFSSEQIAGGRGFSFQTDEPLLMTYDPKAEPVRQILKRLTEDELAKIIKELGEERFPKRIARNIYDRERERPIETTMELAEIVKAAVPRSYEHGRIHPATRTFQALRIYANHELENLERILKNLASVVKPATADGGAGGRAGIISFHSLEDRLVKNYFRDYAKAGQIRLLTKKPIQASRAEALANPRSRSAKLRVAQML